jgi:hypothetical protein
MHYSRPNGDTRKRAAGVCGPGDSVIDDLATEAAPDLPRLEQGGPESREQRSEKSLEAQRAPAGIRQLPGALSGRTAATALGHGFSTAGATNDGRLR